MRTNLPATSRKVAAVAGICLLAFVFSALGAYAGHSFSDVPNGHPFHAEINWLDRKQIANGFDDGTYRPSNAVTRQAMAAFMQRLGTASPMEEEPNDTRDAADLYPPTGPAMGGLMATDSDYWRITHPGGVLDIQTIGLNCANPATSDITIWLYDVNGTFMGFADNDADLCPALAANLAPTTYYLQVGAGPGLGGTVPWYAVMITANGAPLKQ